jgi:hypothetical protein
MHVWEETVRRFARKQEYDHSSIWAKFRAKEESKMPLWGFVLLVCGGLLAVGWLCDRFVSKRRSGRADPAASSLQQSYGETLMDQERKDFPNAP